MTSLPPPEEASRVTRVLQDHLRWSAFWDKKHGLWRVAEDDPDSDLYAESSDADTVIGYIKAHARDTGHLAHDSQPGPAPAAHPAR
jgi:hypothetical protein